MPAGECRHAIAECAARRGSDQSVRRGLTDGHRRDRSDGARRGAPVHRNRPSGVLVRRGQHRAARQLLAGQDARADPADRVDAAALLHPRVGLDARVRRRRGGPALVLRGRRRRGHPGRLRRGRQARLPAGRTDRRRARRVQPVPHLVLAGGPRLLAARAAQFVRAARVRVRAGRSAAAPARVLGDRVRACTDDALLRGRRGRAAGGVAALRARPDTQACRSRSARSRSAGSRWSRSRSPRAVRATTAGSRARRSGCGCGRSFPSS